MARLTKETIEKAREMDVLTYLQMHEPYELVRKGNGVYTTKSHDSLNISNGKWMWWSQNIGGHTALDYLMKVKGVGFRDAVLAIVGDEAKEEPLPFEEKEFVLPEKCRNNDRMIKYLTGRGIDREIIEDCIERGLIYESYPYHNAIFLGKNEQGEVKNACYRSCNDRRIMGDIGGSDKHYSFRLLTEDKTTLHLFESAIDLLSYATIMKRYRNDYRNYNLISLSGIYLPKDGKEMTLPRALQLILKDENVKTISLHLDNDEPGRRATEGLMGLLGEKYEVIDSPPPFGKDFNEYLMQTQCKERTDKDECR